MSTDTEIAAALNRYYQLFTKIGYIADEQMRWPPHDANTLNRDLCRKNGMTDEAIALLEMLPFTTSYAQFGPGSDLVDYSSPEDVECSRHPDNQNEDADEGNPLLPGWIFPIAMHSVCGGEGEAYMIYAREGTFLIGGAQGIEESRVVDPVSYINHLHDKVESFEILLVLRTLLRKPKSETTTGDRGFFYDKAKAAFSDYGWPDHFRKDDFRRDILGLWDHWDKELEARKQRERDAQTEDERIDEYFAILGQPRPANWARSDEEVDEVARRVDEM
ncbi:hypothetical protein H2200_010172 [Cladophialophora chaetospira]|uniref:Uncharacterized protein n=1 Tax=Cladophialophora chaetospira TaxID=386627 RepID=A0AA38X2H1_9EURO|nr:hypothetical protein H2200_010172 [Cladophialophora chaetospira]